MNWIDPSYVFEAIDKEKASYFKDASDDDCLIYSYHFSNLPELIMLINKSHGDLFTEAEKKEIAKAAGGGGGEGAGAQQPLRAEGRRLQLLLHAGPGCRDVPCAGGVSAAVLLPAAADEPEGDPVRASAFRVAGDVWRRRAGGGGRAQLQRRMLRDLVHVNLKTKGGKR